MERDGEKKVGPFPIFLRAVGVNPRMEEDFLVLMVKAQLCTPSVSIRWRIHLDNEQFDLFLIILLIHVQYLQSSFIKNHTIRMRNNIEQVDVGHI